MTKRNTFHVYIESASGAKFGCIGGRTVSEYPDATMFSSKTPAVKLAKAFAEAIPVSEASIYVVKNYGAELESYLCVSGNDAE